MTIAMLLRNTLQAARYQRRAGDACSDELGRGGGNDEAQAAALGELLALVGAACVIVSLLEPWYESADRQPRRLGHVRPRRRRCCSQRCARALAMVLSALTERSTALPVATAVWCVLLGLSRLDRRDRAGARAPRSRHLAVRRRRGSRSRAPSPILVGAWLALRDERPSLYDAAHARSHARGRERRRLQRRAGSRTRRVNLVRRAAAALRHAGSHHRPTRGSVQ